MAQVKTVKYSKWIEVYGVKTEPYKQVLDKYGIDTFETVYTYYITYGGGPTGGYFVDNANGKLFKYSQTWDKYKVRPVFNSKLEYQPVNYEKGIPQRIRIVKYL